jgi:hypothetical protein
METNLVVNNKAEVKEEFIASLEQKINKQFLRDWAMGWMLDIAIDTAIARNTPEEKMFTVIFTIWREKCMELASFVLTHDDPESHLYAGIDLAKISPEICQKWRVRFAHLSNELGIK